MISLMPNHTPTNAGLLARSLSAVWHPCSQMKHYENFPLVPIARGAGVWLYDFDGKRYLDAVSSWWVNLFGHGNPRISSVSSWSRFPSACVNWRRPDWDTASMARMAHRQPKSR